MTSREKMDENNLYAVLEVDEITVEQLGQILYTVWTRLEDALGLVSKLRLAFDPFDDCSDEKEFAFSARFHGMYRSFFAIEQFVRTAYGEMWDEHSIWNDMSEQECEQIVETLKRIRAIQNEGRRSLEEEEETK